MLCVKCSKSVKKCKKCVQEQDKIHKSSLSHRLSWLPEDEVLSLIRTCCAAELGLKHEAGEAEDEGLMEEGGLGALANEMTQPGDAEVNPEGSLTATQIEADALQVIFSWDV